MNQHDDLAAKQWATFLTHPMVKTWHADVSVSTYLCRKALHEVGVGCWTYQQMPRVWEQLNTRPETDAADSHALQTLAASPFQAWYDRWRPVVDRWTSHLTALEDRYGHIGMEQDTDTPLDGPGVIAEIAAIIDPISVMMAEVRALPKPANARVQEFIDLMLGGAERVYEMYSAMRDRDYLRIWIYPGSKEDVA
jgi:hypothetical protein